MCAKRSISTFAFSTFGTPVSLPDEILSLVETCAGTSHFSMVTHMSSCRIEAAAQAPVATEAAVRQAQELAAQARALARQAALGRLGNALEEDLRAVRTLRAFGLESARGVHFPRGIKDDKQVLIAFFSDPDGNDLYLSELKVRAGTTR